MISKKEISGRLSHFLATLVLVWSAILFYRYNPYYHSLLVEQTQHTLLVLASVYTLYSFYSACLRGSPTHGHLLYSLLKRILKEGYHYTKKFVHDSKHPLPTLSKAEKTSLLFMLVKLFFLPLMLNFFYANYHDVMLNLKALLGADQPFTLLGFSFLFYPFFLALFFVVDTLYFAFGYSIESGFLKNTVRSVEPTVFGWLVALICYPPFSELISRYVPWHTNNFVSFGSTGLTAFMRLLILVFLGIYVSATIALGAKCSNLTNRGIVSRGPYAIIRHPAYISKNISWWIVLLPVMSVTVFFGMLFWSAIYFFRAITEERHLIADPDYQAYCKKVKYRFIPGVY